MSKIVEDLKEKQFSLLNSSNYIIEEILDDLILVFTNPFDKEQYTCTELHEEYEFSEIKDLFIRIFKVSPTEPIMIEASEKIEDLIKPELKEHYLQNKYKWFPRDDTKENAKFDKRTPGLFKEEYRGKSIIALCPKMYFVEGADHEDKKYKFSSKGIQKDKNDITKERFEKVLTDQSYKDVCVNRGFRVIDNYMITYTQEKKGMSYYYDKRIVCPNGIDTLPLPI